MHELERALPRQRAARDRRHLRIMVAGAGLATVLAVAAAALSMVGLLPFGSGSSPAQADRDCTSMVVERSERRPFFVRGRSGGIEVRYRAEWVPRLVRRCR